MVTVTIPIPPRSLSPNGRVHWGAKRAATKKARLHGGLAAIMAMSALASIGKSAPRWLAATVSVRVVRRTKRGRMDHDNLVASLKAYIDGVCDAGLLANDRGLSWGAVEWIVAADEKERVELTFVPTKE